MVVCRNNISYDIMPLTVIALWYRLRIDGAKVRNADFCHTVTRVSPANILPFPKIGNNHKLVVKGKKSTILTATLNRLLLLNERKRKNETESRKEERNPSININDLKAMLV